MLNQALTKYQQILVQGVKKAQIAPKQTDTNVDISDQEMLKQLMFNLPSYVATPKKKLKKEDENKLIQRLMNPIKNVRPSS